MTQPVVEVWAQFAPTKDGKWSMKAWAERPDWALPNAKYYLVKIPVPAELLGDEIVAEVQVADEQAEKPRRAQGQKN
jgi:hypothetical protein